MNRYLGIPIFLVIMWLIFQTFTWIGTPLSDQLDAFFSGLTDWLKAGMHYIHVAPFLQI